MRWWKRILFSVISTLWGYISLDYLFYAFQLLTGKRNEGGMYRLKQDAPMQLLGFGMFLLWFALNIFYFCLIRHASNKIDLIEANRKTGKKRVRHRWFDIAVQIAFLLTGMLLRWCYLMFLYFPGIS